MATLDAIRTLTLRAKTEGFDKARADVQALGQAYDTSAKRQLSVDKALQGLQRRYDQEFRAQQELTRVQRTLDQARAAGLITQGRASELMQLATRSLNSNTDAGLTNRSMWRALGREIQLVSPELANLTGAFGGATVGLGRLGPAITGAALAVAGLVKAVIDFAAQEQQLRQMGNAITLIGGASGESAESIKEFIKQMALTGTVTKQAATEAAQALIKFKDIGPGTFGPALEAARRFAGTGLLSVTEAATALGQALTDPTNATEALAKANIELSSSIQKQATELARSGQFWKAQAAIEAEITRQSKQLKDQNDTLAASWTQLTTSVNGSLAALGSAVTNFLSLKSAVSGTAVFIDAIKSSMDKLKTGELELQVDPGGGLPFFVPHGQGTRPGAVRPTLPAPPLPLPPRAPFVSAVDVKQTTDALERQVKTLELQRDAFGKSAGGAAAYIAAQTAIYDLTKTGKVLRDEDIAAINSQAEAIGRLTQAQAASNIAFEIRLQMMAATNSITEEQAQIVQRLAPLYGQSIPAALKSAEAAQLTYIERLKEARRTTDEFASSFSTNLTQGLTDFATGSKTAAEAFKNFSTTVQAEIVRMVLRLTVMNQLERSLKDVLAPLGSAFTPSTPGPVQAPVTVAHGGGVLGLDFFPRALVPPASFDDAPHFQRGGMVSAIPVLAHKGEGIFTPGQMRAMGQGEQNVVVNIENAPSTPQVEQSRGPNGEFNIRVIFDQFAARMADDMRRGRGPLASATAGRFGLNAARGNSANG